MDHRVLLLIRIKLPHRPVPIHLIRSRVTHPDRADLPFLFQLHERPHRVLDRGLLFLPVRLVQIDVIRAQSLERQLHLVADRLRIVPDLNLEVPMLRWPRRSRTPNTPPPRRVDHHRALGRDHNLVAPILDRLANNRLRMPKAINRRGIQQVDPLIERRMNRGDRLALISAPPHPSTHHPSPDRNRGRFNTRLPEWTHVHTDSPLISKEILDTQKSAQSRTRLVKYD